MFVPYVVSTFSSVQAAGPRHDVADATLGAPHSPGVPSG